VAARHLLSGAAAAAWGAAAATGAVERLVAPSPDGVEPLERGPLVSVILPARDEAAAVGDAVRSHLGQSYGAIEVIVVDDESGDGTAERAAAAGGGDPRLRIMRGAPVPEGWVGKSWACWQGAVAARGEWLLFTDADVVHAPDALGRCMAMALRMGRGGLTLAPRVDTGTVAERVVMPAAVALIQNVLAPGFLVRSPRSAVVMAAGAYLLVRRDVYDRAGGHRGVGGHMVDDVALAVAVKRSGALIVPVDGTRMIRLRMYRGVGEMWRGWRKNAAFAGGPDPSRGLLPAVALAAWAAAPGAAMAWGVRRGDPRLAATGLAGLAAQWALQRSAGAVVPTPRRYAPTLAPGALFIAAAAAAGAWDRWSGRGPRWRGRRYPGAA
jgi:hypothetical protein